MSDRGPIYKRRIVDPRSWSDFSIGHVAYALHRTTGWLLLTWIGLHLVVPLLLPGSNLSVYVPRAEWVFIVLFSVLIFHGLNGLRLIAVELGGISANGNRLAFWASLSASVLLLVPLWVGL